MADDKKNIPDAGKADESPKPRKTEPVKTAPTVQDQTAPAKAEAPVVEGTPKVVTPPVAEQPAPAGKDIHNHIYYNSTSLDCSHKFRDFIRSARAVRRLSDRVCLENDLSVITNPKLHSKGRFLHYGAWLGTERQPLLQGTAAGGHLRCPCKRPGQL